MPGPRRTIRLAHVLLAAAAAAGCLVAARPAAAAEPVRSSSGQPEVTVLAQGLQVPWDIAFLPDGRALVTERPGRVRWMSADGVLQPAPAATIAVDSPGDGGLLGVAVDPEFAAGRPFVYFSLTSGGQLRIQRWRLTGDALTFEATILQGVIANGGQHDSGRVRFGPDGALYLGTGEAGVGSRSQDPAGLNGRLLRIPPGAYRGGLVTPEVVAIGLRHPQGLAWQPGTGRMWVTDHGPSGSDGPSGDDELDAIVPGGNYGWPLKRGADQSPFISPTHLWAKTIAPSSLAFVTQPGSTWTGDALVTGLRGEQLRLLSFDGEQVVGDQPLLVGTWGRLRAVAEAPDSAIWVGTSNRDQNGTPGPGDDRILRIVPPAAPPVTPAPAPTANPRTRCRRAAPATRTPPTGPLARRLARSQRIAQLALRRLRGLEARSEGRRVAVVCPRAPEVVRATYRELRIARRISVSALRLHATLSARLLGRRVAAPAVTTALTGAGDAPASRRQVRQAERLSHAALRRATALAKAVRRRASAARSADAA